MIYNNLQYKKKQSVSVYRSDTGDTGRYTLTYSPRCVAEVMRGYSTGTLMLDKYVGISETDRLIEKYCLGTDSEKKFESNGSTIFWQFNTKGDIINGYVVKYHSDGREINRKQINTVGGIYKWSNWFFGGDLIPRANMIGIVDNEMTCLVAASVCKEVTWIATNNLQVDVLNLVKYGGRNVVLYPSDISLEYWKDIGDNCNVPTSDALAIPYPINELCNG